MPRFLARRAVRIALPATGIAFALALTRPGSAAVLTTASADGASVPVYVARPAEGARLPAVLVLHGCEGFDGFYAVMADRLAHQDVVAVALDAPSPATPSGSSCDDPDGSRREAAAARTVLAWLATRPDVDPARLAVVGYSMGAIAALDLVDPAPGDPAPPAGLRAAVAFYPSCAGRKPSLRVPLAIFDGSDDRITPAAPCRALVAAATAAGEAASITTYPGATHAFPVDAPDRTFRGEPLRYDHDAEAASAAAEADFLSRYLTPSP